MKIRTKQLPHFGRRSYEPTAMSGTLTLQPIRFSLLYHLGPQQWVCYGPAIEIVGGGRKHRLTLARASLIAAGFKTPDQAEQQLRNRLPREPRHAIPLAEAYKPKRVRKRGGEQYLLAALILGRCVDGVFDPERPHIWSEKRLSQRLVLFQPKGFYDQ